MGRAGDHETDVRGVRRRGSRKCAVGRQRDQERGDRGGGRGERRDQECGVGRRSVLRAGAGLAATGAGSLAGCLVGSKPGPLVSESFEDGMEEWTEGAAIGPEVPLEEFERSATLSDERAHTGTRSVELFTEGSYDDGVVWITRRLDTADVDADRLRVTVHAWSQSESFNTLRNLVCSLSPDPPTAEEDFPDPETVSSGEEPTRAGGLRQPLHRVEGWDEYSFDWRPSGIPDELYLSVGVAVVWEADATHFVDDVRVESIR